jgi:ATP-binding cassette subfamily B protein
MTYGVADPCPGQIGHLVERAQLREVVEALPDGLLTPLGEGGGLLSGGEGQRVRLARALARRDARLVLLDEPFRGLDRERRTRLLEAARAQWRAATLICVTHDVADTLDFPRVIVMERGKVIEDGAPVELRARCSIYARMLASDATLHARLSTDRRWRSLRVERGKMAPLNGSEP